MTKPILFRGFDILGTRLAGFGDVFDYSFACYLLGKELGYDKVHIVFPRMGPVGPTNAGIEGGRYWQETKFLPWKWYPLNKIVNPDDWDKIIDTTQRDSLYPGFPGIKPHLWYVTQALSYYHIIKHVEPYLDGVHDYNSKPYILFQYRDNSVGGFESNSRCTVPSQFQALLEIIKKTLGNKYEYWQIGNASPYENQFDRVIPLMYDDIDGFVKMIFDSSLVVASHSGPWGIANCVRELPVIAISVHGGSYAGSPTVWKGILGGHPKTEKHPTWCDNKSLVFMREDEINRDPIIQFLNKWKILK